MQNLKQDLLKNIEYLKTHGEKLEYRNDFEKLFASSEFTFKTSQVIKDTVSILEIDNTLKSELSQEILKKYFQDYLEWIDTLGKLKK